MAIKGKSKAKSRPKQVARAPRREPVTVKPPFLQRRWVQVTAAFVVGILAMTLAIWVTNGLRQNRQDTEAADAATTRRTAAAAWQGAVEGATASIGTPNQGLPPTVFAEMNAAFDSMKKGTVPDGAADTFQQASDNAQKTITAINHFDLSGTISDQGFSAEQATAFSDSKDRLVASIQLYQKAAQVGQQAVEASGVQRAALTKIAIGLRDSAQTQFQQAWSIYRQALAAGGLVEQAPGTIPGVT